MDLLDLGRRGRYRHWHLDRYEPRLQQEQSAMRGISPISTSVRLLKWRCGKRWMDRRRRKREWAWCTISTSVFCTKILSMKRLSISQARYSFIHTPFCSSLFVFEREKPTAGSNIDTIQIKTRTSNKNSTKRRWFPRKDVKAKETAGSLNFQNGRTASYRTLYGLSEGGDRCVGPLVTRWICLTTRKERIRRSFPSEEAQSPTGAEPELPKPNEPIVSWAMRATKPNHTGAVHFVYQSRFERIVFAWRFGKTGIKVVGEWSIERENPFPTK